MDIELWDGTVIEGVPDGLSRSEIRAGLLKRGINPDPPAERPNPTDDMGAFERGAAGAGKAMYDVGRGVGQLFGLKSQEDIDDAKSLDADLAQTTGGKVGNVIGNVGVMLPAALIPGVNTVAGSALLGGATGFAQPVASDESRTVNTVFGAGAGAAGAGVAKSLGLVKAAAQPLYRGGQRQILARLLNKSAGSNADDVAARLGSSAELVPGSAPTAAQVADSGGIAALERAARAVDPDAYAARDIAQNQARRAALGNVAGDDAAMSAAVAERESAVKPLYDAAKAANILPDAEFAELAQRPAVQEAIRRAEAMMAERGVKEPPPGEFMHAMKMSLDDMLQTGPQRGVGGAENKAVADTRAAFLGWLEKKSPEYGKARTLYAEKSAPINQMEVGRALRDKLTPALADSGITYKERANALAEALRSSDKTVRGATGLEGKEIADVLSPQQLASVRGVVDDLARKDVAQNLGRGAGSDTVQKLSMTNLMEQAGVPAWVRKLPPAQVAGSLMGRAGGAVYGQADKEMQQMLAQALLNPKDAAALMRSLPPEKARLLSHALRFGSAALPIGAVQAQ